MRVVCLGGGPAGLYFAISMKLRDPSHEAVVVERNEAGDTFGWGVVFSDQTLGNLRANDPASAAVIEASFAHWDDVVVDRGDESVRSGGHGFIGIGRKRLLNILQDRARELGVELLFETEFDGDLSRWADYDLIVASDGVNSRIRADNEARFGVDIDVRANKFIWLGTDKLFDAFHFIFEKTEAGWLWAHAYRFDETRSTFIVECSQETWDRFGFAAMDQEETIAACEAIFAAHLDGRSLLTNANHLRGSAAWINFRRVLCRDWYFDNVVLLGDAAHTAHFSIGSGTKLALEDAIKLADVLGAGVDSAEALQKGLADYQAERKLEVVKIQNSARNSTEWFEAVDRYIDFPMTQFAYALMTRSQRVSHENLRLRDPAWLADVERWFSGDGQARPPMFTPYRIGGIVLPNRVVVSPVLTYQATPDGLIGDFHIVHYGVRAEGGAGLVIAEMTAVSPEGRYTDRCPGIWNDEQAAAWKRLIDFVHRESDTKFGLQIGHSGPRGEGVGAPLLAASSFPYDSASPIPRSCTQSDIDRLTAAFVAAAVRADRAGFDMVEIQAGHGTLLSSFITPVLNQRSDAFGGSLENRLRFPLQVVSAVRDVLSPEKPLAVRISGNDWVGAAGIQPADAVLIAKALVEAGAELIDVSAGETASEGKPVYGRMFQTPLADRIRNELRVPVIAVGNIYEADHVNSILAAGRADLVALGRPHLANPMWTLHQAVKLGYQSVRIPEAYRSGVEQLGRIGQASETAIA